jgi:hypothetical protein
LNEIFKNYWQTRRLLAITVSTNEPLLSFLVGDWRRKEPNAIEEEYFIFVSW